MDLIIFAHPDNENSHNAAVLKHITQRLRGANRQFAIIDLYKDGFDPVLRIKNEDKRNRLLIENYSELITKSDRMIFIFPVWWYNLPAIMKGFIDLVFTSDFAYVFETNLGKDEIAKQKFTKKKAIVINTFGRAEGKLINSEKAFEEIFDNTILRFCGVDVKRINWFEVKQPALVPSNIMKLIDEALSNI
ncbi:NAD(P)H-dependent oxidoreductase [Candidatus Micrarchaeota archaeon]|nr:NAD(P)H-dependent oxidoreductase [Candidatus Micrarchaeota archaeon]MBU1165432.1 NAD(P)H-dependent oxidoreductase [Candidatus Micrarchaeota archaeon]MBU1887216.1 NAD(P)H-dependent oxidoreductase [Candidatus Micrarchaeota archaeon]